MASDTGRGRPRRILGVTVLAAVVLAGVLVAWGGRDRGDAGPVAAAATTRPAPSPATTAPAAASTVPPATRRRAAPATRAVVLRPDGLGVGAFGASKRDALDRLERRLGAPDERGSWTAANPFGTCPGRVRAARWGRLYVLFTSGPTRYGPSGRWHLFAWQVDAVQRTKVDPSASGPTPPPDPPPLHGYSPRTAAGVGFGATLAELRAAYGSRLMVGRGEPGAAWWFRVGFGAAGELSGSLSGGRPSATVTWLAAGAICGE
jgi:hypothetical protein